jgi:hypothetical protein
MHGSRASLRRIAADRSSPQRPLTSLDNYSVAVSSAWTGFLGMAAAIFASSETLDRALLKPVTIATGGAGSVTVP